MIQFCGNIFPLKGSNDPSSHQILEYHHTAIADAVQRYEAFI